MRYAFISDIHANIEALSPVLDAIDALDVGAIYCLGDIVGRNANPNEVLDALRARKVQSVAGNHDRAALGTKEMTHFRESAQRAVLFARERLSPENRRYLEELPLLRTVDDHFLLVHAALHPEPNDDVYLNSSEPITESLNALKAREGGPKLAFFGHTHRPGVHRLRVRGTQQGKVESCKDGRQKLHPDSVYLINPGSVGQSRDGDWRASFLIYDRDRAQVEIHRVSFDLIASLARSRDATQYEAKAQVGAPPVRASAPPARVEARPLKQATSSVRRPSRPGLSAVVHDAGDPNTKRIGAHSVRFEPPDTVALTYVGDVSIEEAGAIVEAIKLFAPEKSWVLTISDMQHLGATSAGARSALVHAASLTRGAVFYGVTSRPQMLHALLAAAFTPAHRDADIPLLFFDAEAEAKAWLVERRRALGAPRKQGA